MARPTPLMIVILDGWGISFVQEGNAILQAPTPNMDTFLRYYPSASVQASGIEVGLPWGEVGNSETGHRNVGAGNVQYQTLPYVDNAIAKGDFYTNEALLGAVKHVQKNGSSLHIMGLVSPGGVHAHINHLFALLDLCKRQSLIDRVYIHMFTDGRDTPPKSALTYLKSLQKAIGKFGVGIIASVTGRFYAMDRNKNWERTQTTYDMLVGGERKAGAPTAEQAITQAYASGTTDEMILPTSMTRGGGPIATVQDNDAIIFFNYRPDRARQITQAFVQPDTVGFETKKFSNLYFATMSQYDPNIPAPYAFREDPAEYPLARVISDVGLKQFHIAETEKYAHVTYYINVGHEEPFPGEEHQMIPSSDIISFADDPHMQAESITNQILEHLATTPADVYFINYANADMVGHTGNFEAAKEACGFVDACLGRLAEAVFKTGGALLITADHGNAEEMLHPETGEPEKDHTSNPVPLHFVHAGLRRTTMKSDQEVVNILSYPIGVLADIAPTALEILEIQKPPTMTGVSLLSSLQ